MEHEERADRLEREVDDLERRSEQLEEHIEEARQDWEHKAEDSTVPGAQPDPADEEDETVTETPHRESDQLPEEHPSEAVPDDTGDGQARDEAKDGSGAPDDEGTATGNPDAAGSDEG